MMKIMPDWFKNMLNKMGLKFVADADKIADAFHLPPDTDDSSVNIGNHFIFFIIETIFFLFKLNKRKLKM